MPGIFQKQYDFIYENMFQNMSDGFACFEIIADSDNKPLDIVIHEVNPSFEKIILQNPAAIVGKRLLDIFPELSEFFLDLMNTVISREKESSSIKFIKFIPQVYKLINFSVFKQRNGYFYALFHEMTEYRQEAGVIKNMVDGIVYYQQVFDEDGNVVNYKVLNVNPAFVRMMHNERRNVVGKLLTEIIPASFEYSIIVDAIKEVLKTEQPKTYEHYSKRIGKWLSITLFSPNEGYGAAVFTDITRFKLLESTLTESQKNAEEANNAKSELLTNISHELRTPLNVILSATQLFSLYLGDDRLYKKENASRHIKTMKQNCLRLIRLVNNILDSDKIDSGLFELDIKNYDLVNVIRKIINSTEEYAHMKGNKVLFCSNSDSKIMAFDMNAMERVMLNLLSNAFKFSRDEGDIIVNINCEANSVTLSVKDEGIGIAKDKQELIFERFKQASSFIVKENEGSGLGLAITKTLVEMHDGTISVKSEEGAGSEFIVMLPCKILNKETVENRSINLSERLVERINVEFSDIYL